MHSSLGLPFTLCGQTRHPVLGFRWLATVVAARKVGGLHTLVHLQMARGSRHLPNVLESSSCEVVNQTCQRFRVSSVDTYTSRRYQRHSRKRWWFVKQSNNTKHKDAADRVLQALGSDQRTKPSGQIEYCRQLDPYSIVPSSPSGSKLNLRKGVSTLELPTSFPSPAAGSVDSCHQLANMLRRGTKHTNDTYQGSILVGAELQCESAAHTPI